MATKFISEVLPAEFGGDTITYSLPGCLNEPGNSEPNQMNFEGHNAFRSRRGQPPATFEEYLEWHKT